MSQLASAVACAGAVWILRSFGLTVAFLYVVVVVVGYSLWRSFVYPFLLSPLRHLPEPEGGKWLTGHSKILRNERSGLSMDDWENTIPNDGLIRYRMELNRERILVTGGKALAEILVHSSYDFVKPAKLRVGLGRLLGVGLIVADGEAHKIQRKQLMPAFAFRHIKELYPIFWMKGSQMAVALSEALSRNEANSVDISGWFARTTLDIIGVAGLGQDFNAISHPDNNIVAIYRNVFEPKRPPTAMFFIKSWAQEQMSKILPVRPPNVSDSILRAAADLRDIARTLVQRKQNILKKHSEGSEGPEDKDIISVALRSGHFNEDDMVNQVMTFLAAGHETTATSLTWAALALCQDPKVQKKLRAEVWSHLPDPLNRSATVNPEQIDNLPYLRAVCSEVFRLYPPAGITKRVAAKDCMVMNYLVPRGTTIVISPRATNHSKALWGENAMEFVPERWLKDDGQTFNAGGGTESNYAMLTFLHGPRSCIGERFARAEFASLLAILVGRFTMRLEEPLREIEIETGLTSKPKGGLRIYMEPLATWGSTE